MTKYMIRTAALIFASISTLLFVINLSSKFWMPIPGIRIQHLNYTTTDEISLTAYDVQTGVKFPYTYALWDRSPDGKLAYEIDLEAQEHHLYLRRLPNGEPQLLGVYEEIESLSSIAWSFDSQSLYVASKPLREDTHLYQIDVKTGDISLYGTFDFDGRPNSMYMITDHLLLMERYIGQGNYFVIIDMLTGEMTSYDTSFNRRFSQDRKYMAYGSFGYFARSENEAASTRSILHILNLETMERFTIEEEMVGEKVFEPLAWSPNLPILPLILNDGRILIYDVETQSLTALPENYRQHADTWSFWSNDGTRMIVFDEITGKHLVVNYETGEEVILQIDIDAVSHQWSRDDRYLLISENFTFDENTSQIYSTTTGELVRDISKLIYVEAGYYYATWMWNIR